MFLVMSRAATYCRGDFAVDFRSDNRRACETWAVQQNVAEQSAGWPARERIVVDIVVHYDPDTSAPRIATRLETERARLAPIDFDFQK